MAGGETLDDFQTNNGEPVHVGMFVCLFPADPNAELYIARIDKMYKSEEGKRLIQILWFYRPKELQHEPPSKALKNEVYHTNYFDCQPVESIANICKVFIKSEYLKLNEAQRRSVCEEDIFFFEYAYSAENGSFTKMSASGNAHIGRSLGKRNSSDRTMEASLKVLINALIELEETLSRDALPASWTYKRSITQRLLHLVESIDVISPALLLQNIEHLKFFLHHRHGNILKKRKRCWSADANNKEKLPLLQDVAGPGTENAQKIIQPEHAMLTETPSAMADNAPIMCKGREHSISQGLLHLVECLQGKKKSNYLPAWKKAVLEADSSPASLLEHIDHLKNFLHQRSGNKQKKRKCNWYEHADNKDKLPPLQEVCEILDDSDKNVGRIKEGGLCKFLCDQLALKWGLRLKVKINRKPRSYEMTSMQEKLQENRMSCQQKQRHFALDEDELAVCSQRYCMKAMNLNKEKKMLPQEEDCGISKEMFKDLEAQVNCLRKEDDKELQIKSLGKTVVKTSQIECPLEHSTNLSGITMLRCNIVDRVERLETLDHTFLQEMESNHRAEKKQLQGQITKLTEALERVQEMESNHRAEKKQLKGQITKLTEALERVQEMESNHRAEKRQFEDQITEVIQALESSQRAEKKQLEDQITKLTETLERVQEEMKCVLKSIDKSTVTARKTSAHSQDTELSVSPESQSVEVRAPVAASPAPERQKELISMYVSHLATPNLPWVQMISQHGHSPVPESVLPVLSYSAVPATHMQGGGGGGGGCRLDVPEGFVTTTFVNLMANLYL